MTQDEAIKVLEVVSEADGGCPSCVGDLVTRLVQTFPSIDWAAAAEAAKVFDTLRYRGAVAKWIANATDPSYIAGQ